MNQNPLQQFARQLHAWATDELRQTPGPFRTVELFATLLGETEEISPPLVFWINRESHLAGGVILLPKDNPSETLESGREICAALGLDSYYTWGISEISAWQVDSVSGRQWTEPIPDSAMHETGTFREILTLVIQNMQNRFFRSQQSLPKLSPPYITNLLHNCIESAQQIPFTPVSESPPDKKIEAGRSHIACLILQMLALYLQDALPAKTDPDNLIADLNQQLERLPAPLFAALSLNKPSKEVSGAVTVKLHHLYQRLQQLGPELFTFMPETITRLLQFWTESAELIPLPAPLKKNRPTLIINPDRYYPDMSVSIEIAAPPLTAATALLRFLQSPDRRHPSQLSDLLDLKKSVCVDEVNGSLTDQSKPTISEQTHLNMLLRHSWPNRHLKLASTSPRWVWRLVHLVGLLQGSPQGTLTLPADWLWAPYGEQFFRLISERVDLNRITPLANNRIQIKFNQPNKKQQITVDSFENDVRVIAKADKEVTRTELLLALCIPTAVYDLLRNGEIRPITDVTPPLDAVKLFLNSTLGKGFRQILSPKKKLPKDEKLMAEIIKTALPLPGKKVLEALLVLKRKNIQLDTTAIDRELEAWLGSASLSKIHPRFKTTVAKAVTSFENNRAEEIAKQLIRSGEVLTFPLNYLYDIPEKSRRSYSIPGPLSISETFFNSITLSTPTGDIVQVEGFATARALQLISTMHTGEIELPDGEEQNEIILTRYLRDLKNLFEHVQQSAAGSTAVTKNELIDQIWMQLPVPPRAGLNFG